MSRAGIRVAALVVSGVLLNAQVCAAWAAPESISRNAPQSVSTPEIALAEPAPRARGIPAWWWVVGLLGGAALAGLAIGAGGGGGGGDEEPAPATGSIDVSF